MYDIVTRGQAVLLYTLGIALLLIYEQTGISTRQIKKLHRTALERGWQPGTPLTSFHVAYKEKKGRPQKLSQEDKNNILNFVENNPRGREQALRDLAREFKASHATIRKFLRSCGFRKTKPTTKPGLKDGMKKARLEFCQKYQSWTIEDWKRVIWIDETSVLLGIRRGAYRIWRRSWEAFKHQCIRQRWKGFSEFMFWGCFTYNFKGPCHIWKPESDKEKTEASKVLKTWNTAIEPEMKRRWEEEVAARRATFRGRQRSGRPPTWKFTQPNGAFIRKSSGGLDWWRYLTTILLPKLIPFAQAVACYYPDVIIQEDKAPSHASKYQEIYFSVAEINRFLWPGNSPDLNMIEPCWAYMKRVTTKNGPLTSRLAAEKAWLEAWKNLEQWRIQAWIERIPAIFKKF